MAPELRIKINADTSDFKNQVKGLGNEAQKAFSFINQAGATAAGIFSANMFSGAISGIREFTSGIIDAVDQMQGLEKSLEAITRTELMKTGGDLNDVTKNAKELTKWMRDLAIVSPYGYQAVANVFKQNANMGQTTEIAQKTTKAVLNLASGLGLTMQQMSGLGNALAQTSATGVINKGDIRQFANNGFGLDKMNDVFKQLTENTGVMIDSYQTFNKAVEECKITTDDFFIALDDYANKYYGGSAEQMAQTIGGLKSTMEDIGFFAKTDVFKPVGDDLAASISKVVGTISDLLGAGMFSSLGENLKTLFEPAIKKLDEFGDKFEEVGAKVEKEIENGNFKRGIDNLIGYFTGKDLNLNDFALTLTEIAGTNFTGNVIEKLEGFKRALTWIHDNSPKIIGALKGILIAILALKAVNTITSLISAMSNPITLIIGLAALFAAAWEANLGGVQEKFQKFLDKITEIKNKLHELVWGEESATFKAVNEGITGVSSKGQELYQQYFLDEYGRLQAQDWDKYTYSKSGARTLKKGAVPVAPDTFEEYLEANVISVKDWYQKLLDEAVSGLKNQWSRSGESYFGSSSYKSFDQYKDEKLVEYFKNNDMAWALEDDLFRELINTQIQHDSLLEASASKQAELQGKYQENSQDFLSQAKELISQLTGTASGEESAIDYSDVITGLDDVVEGLRNQTLTVEDAKIAVDKWAEEAPEELKGIGEELSANLDQQGATSEAVANTIGQVSGMLGGIGKKVEEISEDVAASAEDETKKFGSDWGKTFSSAMNDEYGKFIESHTTEILQEMGETAKSYFDAMSSKDDETIAEMGQKWADAVEKLGFSQEQWFGQTVPGQNQSAQNLFTAMTSSFEANLGTTLDGIRQVTSDNWAEARDFLTSIDTWQTFAETVAFGGAGVTEDYMLTGLKDMMTSVGYSNEQIKATMESLQITMKDMDSEQKMSWLKFLISGVDTTIGDFAEANDKGLKAVDASVNKLQTNPNRTNTGTAEAFDRIIAKYNTATGKTKDLLGYQLQAMLDATGVGNFETGEGRLNIVDLLNGETNNDTYRAAVAAMNNGEYNKAVYDAMFKTYTQNYIKALQENQATLDEYGNAVEGLDLTGTTGEEGEGATSGSLFSLLFGNPEIYAGLSEALTPEVLTAMQSLLTTELDAETWGLFAQSLTTIASGFTTMAQALSGGEEGTALSVLMDNTLTSAQGLEEFFSGTLTDSITNLTNAMAQTSTDENGEVTAGGGNTLYTAMGVIKGLFEDIKVVSERMVNYWNGELYNAVIKLQMETTPIAVRSLQKIKKSVSSLGDAIFNVITLLGEMIGLLEGMDGIKVPTVGGGTSNSETGSTGSKKPTKKPKVTGPPEYAGGGGIFPYGTAIVGEHGPEIIRTGSSRLNVFANTQLMDEIAHTRHALNMLSNSAEAVYTNRMLGGGMNTSNTDNSQHFENHFGAVIGDKAFRDMVENTVRDVWRREMRLAS